MLWNSSLVDYDNFALFAMPFLYSMLFECENDTAILCCVVAYLFISFIQSQCNSLYPWIHIDIKVVSLCIKEPGVLSDAANIQAFELLKCANVWLYLGTTIVTKMCLMSMIYVLEPLPIEQTIGCMFKSAILT